LPGSSRTACHRPESCAAGTPSLAGPFGDLFDWDRLPFAGAQQVDRLAVRDRDQPRLGVRGLRQVRVGAQRRQERLRPGIVGVRAGEQDAADAQHRGAVVRHDLLERMLGVHALKTLPRPET